MPRVRPLTEALRLEEEQRKQAERTKNIISGAAKCAGLNLTDLARMTGLRYETMLRHLGSGKLSVKELTAIGQALRFDLNTYAACCGAKERCRFERGGAA